MRGGYVRAALQARLPQLRLPPRLLRPVNEQAWEDITRPMQGSLVVLEPLDAAHEDGLYEAAREDRAAWRWLPHDASESRGAFGSWLEEALAASGVGREAAFATLDARSGRPIGSTRYLSLRPEHRGVEIGWTWLSPSAWGTGANVEAKLLMLRRAFGTLGCIRVEFQTNARNERSRAALEVLPARFEGVLRKHKFVQRGEARDTAYYSIIDDEWPGVEANLRRRLAG